MNNDKDKQTRPPNPRATCNPISAATFFWLNPLFWKGFKTDLEEKDLPVALDEHASAILGDKFERLWAEEEKKKSPSLFRVIVKCYGLYCMLLGCVIFFLECIVRMSQPLFLGRLIQYFTSQNITKNEAYYYAIGVIACSAINVLLVHPYVLGMLHLGMKFRVACCSLIYRKSLRLSKTALGETTIGQIVNLLSNDVNRFDVATMFVHYLWVGPISTAIATYLMWRQVGVSSIVGIVIILALIPMQAWLGKKTSVLRLKTALRTDERVRLMSEIINGIQVIKMYTWEDPFTELVRLARKNEIKEIRGNAYIRGMVLSFAMFVTRVALFASLIAYVLQGSNITADKVFILTAYYNMLRQTMTMFFPQGIAQIAEARISIQRLQKFLLFEENKNVFVDNKPASKSDKRASKKVSVVPKLDRIAENYEVDRSRKPFTISLNNINTKWLKSQPEDTLTNITMNVKPGSLVAVVGPVGSGKSSLFNVILKELDVTSGTVEINGKVSYASQEPWLFVGSIRQNILFGNEMNKTRYSSVVRCCSLERDFTLFPYGDKTVVGERGISLSGGQRARINLARAVYRLSDIYLLDDPLSAVDTHVGRELFDNCIVGYLGGKTRILITHQLQYLSDVDHIIILKDGKIAAEGTFQSLQESGLDFAELLKSNQEEGTQKVKPVEEEEEEQEFTRQLSIMSVTSMEDSGLPNTGPTDELKSTGTIGSYVYTSYAKATGPLYFWGFLIFLAVISQVFGSAVDYWSSFWVNVEEKTGDKENASLEEIIIDSWITLTRGDFIYIYAGIIGSLIILTIWRSLLFFNLTTRASNNLHNNMFYSITRTTMRFFHTNPSGRILNRFSKDMGAIDELLPAAMIDVLQIALIIIGIVIVIIICDYWLTIPTVVIFAIFYYLRVYYIASARSIKRLEGITRSPVFSHLSATLQGMTTIRAFGAQHLLEKEFDNHQDLHSSAWYLFIATSRAFGYWLDSLCVVYITLVTMSFLLIDQGSSAGNVGLAITQVIGLTGLFQWGMKQSAEMENQMTSVERVVEYSKLEREPPLKSEKGKEPPKEWPQSGALAFDKVWMRYSPDGEPVIRDLSFKLLPAEKLGIVGRTGAGKSSIISALFRLAYMEGDVIIDGIKSDSIGLHELRSKLSIIPQEPVLFSGTMRKNLDPFNEYSDEVLWNALEDIELKDVVSEAEGGLDSKMLEGGANFSVGQRQLVCLARAIIRNNKILVMDEATANVDPQTDALIQNTIRKKFSHCTVLTIAHRLHTIMDSDKVLVMSAGTMMEFDHPYVLLQNKDGIFKDMVNQTGENMSESLFQIAKQSYKDKQRTNEKSKL